MSDKDTRVEDEANDVKGNRSFGKMLEAARLASGYSINQLAEATRIQPMFLEALEKEDFDSLPGLVFGRGFIKSLSKAIGADPEQLLEAYETAVQQKKDEGKIISQPTVLEAKSKNPITTRIKSDANDSLTQRTASLYHRTINSIKSSGKYAIIAISVICCVGLIVAVYNMSNRDSSLTSIDDVAAQLPMYDNDSEQNDLENNSIITMNDNDNRVISESADTLSSTPDGEDVIDAATMQQSLEEQQKPSNMEQLVEINVKVPVTVRSRIDNGKWNSSELGVDRHQFRFKDSMNVLILNAASVDVYFNGKSLGSLGKEGRVRRITFLASSEDLDLEKSKKS